MNRRTAVTVVFVAGVLASMTAACSTGDSAVDALSPTSNSAMPTMPSTADQGTHTTSPDIAPPDDRPVNQETEPAVTTPADQPDVTHAPQSTTTTSASTVAPCDSASAGSFATIAANSSIAYQLVKPIVFDNVQCVGTSARARTAPDGEHQPTGVLFRYSPGSNGGQWIAVAVGSAIDCGSYGASAAEAAGLEGCL